MRVLIYSHDTYGLGHLRRSLIIAKALSTSNLDASVLIATGSPRAQSFELPRGCDTMKLPAIIKRGDGSYAARDLDLPLRDVVSMRSNLLCSAYRDFKPDMIIVDHSPLGVENELVPLLEAVRNSKKRPCLILGMRDIVDDAAKTKETWIATGAMSAIENDYDRVFVYGSSWVPTTAQEIGFDRLVDRQGDKKTRHLGYIARGYSLGEYTDRVLVTAGGGGDGQKLLRSFVGFLSRTENDWGAIDIVSGPFLSERKFKALASQIRDLAHDVQLIRFDPKLEDRIATSKAVIGMAGYNTVTEIMSTNRPALLVPRETPRVEQLLRAERLSEACGFSWCRSSQLDDQIFEDFLLSCDRPKKPHPEGIALTGSKRLVEEINELIRPSSPFGASRKSLHSQIREGA